MEHRLPSGDSFIVDEQDLDLVSSYKWHLLSGNTPRVARRVKRKYVFLHQLIKQRIGIDPKRRTTFKNRNPLDLRRNNFTFNLQRRRGKVPTTGHKGISIGYKGAYIAKLYISGLGIRYIGSYKTLEAALEAQSAYANLSSLS